MLSICACLLFLPNGVVTRLTLFRQTVAPPRIIMKRVERLFSAALFAKPGHDLSPETKPGANAAPGSLCSFPRCRYRGKGAGGIGGRPGAGAAIAGAIGGGA